MSMEALGPDFNFSQDSDQAVPIDVTTLLRDYADGRRRFLKVDLKDSNLSHAQLSCINLEESILQKANLCNANLAGAVLNHIDFSSANLVKANLIAADLIRAKLAGASLAGAFMSGANLSGANLRRANLTDCTLAGANLSGVDFTGAILRNTNLNGSNLRGANLSAVDLTDLNLTELNLDGAILSAGEAAQLWNNSAGQVSTHAPEPDSMELIAYAQAPEDPYDWSAAQLLINTGELPEDGLLAVDPDATEAYEDLTHPELDDGIDGMTGPDVPAADQDLSTPAAESGPDLDTLNPFDQDKSAAIAGLGAEWAAESLDWDGADDSTQSIELPDVTTTLNQAVFSTQSLALVPVTHPQQPGEPRIGLSETTAPGDPAPPTPKSGGDDDSSSTDSLPDVTQFPADAGITPDQDLASTALIPLPSAEQETLAMPSASPDQGIADHPVADSALLDHDDDDEAHRETRFFPVEQIKPPSPHPQLNSRVVQSIQAALSRRTQYSLQRKLLEVYEQQCAITGCKILPLLETVLIGGYDRTIPDHPSQGMVLRSDLKTLYELKLLAIHPQRLTVILAPSLLESDYGHLQDRSIHMPQQKIYQPDATSLANHLQACKWYTPALANAPAPAPVQSSPVAAPASRFRSRSPLGIGLASLAVLGLAAILVGWFHPFKFKPDPEPKQTISDQALPQFAAAPDHRFNLQLGSVRFYNQGQIIEDNAYLPLDLAERLGLNPDEIPAAAQIKTEGQSWFKVGYLKDLEIPVGWDSQTRTILLDCCEPADIETINLKMNGGDRQETGLIIDTSAYVPVGVLQSLGLDLDSISASNGVSYDGQTYLKASSLPIQVQWQADTRTLELQN